MIQVLKKLFDKIEYDDSVERALKCFNNIKSQHLNNLYGTWEFEESMCFVVALHDAAKIDGELFIKV